MPDNKNDYIADRPLYLDESGQVVEHSNPAKMTKLVSAGGRVPEDKAKALGLVKDPEPEAAVVESKAENAPPENKAVASPKETKATGPRRH